jgi:anti-sigma-K factor RskA
MDPTTAPSARRVAPVWRALAIVLMLVLAVAAAAGWSMWEQFTAQIRHLHTQLAQQPQVRHVAVLLNAQAQPAMLVTFDPTSKLLQLQRLDAVVEGREDSMQLWALDGDHAPRSLGVLTPKLKTLQLPADANALQSVRELAISVEDRGGVGSAQGPRLPYLFKGWLVQKAQ